MWKRMNPAAMVAARHNPAVAREREVNPEKISSNACRWAGSVAAMGRKERRASKTPASNAPPSRPRPREAEVSAEDNPER